MRYLILLILFSNLAIAKTPTVAELKTIRKIAVKYGIDSQKLIAIAAIESRFNQSATRSNKNGTLDVGMFQVNSIHWDTTCKGLDIFTLKGNVTCAAKIIVKNMRYASTDKLWLGRYHSKTPSRKLAYHNKIMELLAKK